MGAAILNKSHDQLPELDDALDAGDLNAVAILCVQMPPVPRWARTFSVLWPEHDSFTWCRLSVSAQAIVGVRPDISIRGMTLSGSGRAFLSTRASTDMEKAVLFPMVWVRLICHVERKNKTQICHIPRPS
jgi:hypothetical protein